LHAERGGARRLGADTELATLAPSASARALASLRLIASRLPVKTIVLPASGEAARVDGAS
jgi:hypothetical protein